MTNEQDFQTILSNEHRLFDLHLRETLRYKDLILLLVKRDFIARYKQTVLGPLWAVIQPLLTTVVFTLVFGKLAKLATMDAPGDHALPAFLFYMSGTICWNFFSSALQDTSGTFLYNRGLMGKVYFPRFVVPLASGLSKLITFAIQFGLFCLLLLIFAARGEADVRLTPMLLMLPLSVLQLYLFSIGCGILISSVTTKYRDLAMLVGFGLQLWQYATPIAYGLRLVPERWLRLYMLNPLAPAITTFRYAAFGFGYFDLGACLVSWLITLLVFFVGLMLFSRIERTFMDTI